MAEFTCRNCLFWKPETEATADHQALYGECRRMSPRPLVDRIADETSALWPPTSAADWCGEHRPDSFPLPLRFHPGD